VGTTAPPALAGSVAQSKLAKQVMPVISSIFIHPLIDLVRTLRHMVCHIPRIALPDTVEDRKNLREMQKLPARKLLS
jgi:hypothetical protein